MRVVPLITGALLLGLGLVGGRMSVEPERIIVWTDTTHTIIKPVCRVERKQALVQPV